MPKKYSKKQTAFSQKVYEVVRKIPKGKVLSYKRVARLAGRPGAWRAVGNILNKNKKLSIPCHRVIRSDRIIGGYNRGKLLKISLLKKEGVLIKDISDLNRIVDVGHYRRSKGSHGIVYRDGFVYSVKNGLSIFKIIQ